MRFSLIAVVLVIVGCGPHWRTPTSVLAKCKGSDECIKICTDYQDVQFGQLYCKQLQRAQVAGTADNPGNASPANVHVLGVPNSPLPTSMIVSRSLPAVVKIQTGLGFGSGFALTEHGLIVTNYHVIAGQSSIAVEFNHGRIEYISEIAAYSEPLDLAILRVSTIEVALAIARDDYIEVGDPVLAIGHPLGYNSSVAAGILSGRRMNENNIEQLQTTLPMAPGASGGPLLDRYGRVVGIMQAAVLNAQLLSFAIPIGQVKPLLYKAIQAPKPTPIAEFARLTGTQKPGPETEFPPVPPPPPPVSQRVLQGCSRADRALITNTTDETVYAGGYLCEAHISMPCVYVYLGAALALEQHLSAACKGPREMLSKARQDAVKLADAKAHEKALQTLFESLGAGARGGIATEPNSDK